MCILFIKLLKAAKPGEFKLILASNRDEFFKRPGKNAHFWEEDNNIFGGRDMTENKQGGTWLAMSKSGKIGVLLNATGDDHDTQKLGRGFLVADFLKTPLADKEYMEKIMQSANQYNKFHLVTTIVGQDPRILHYTNSHNGPGITEIQTEVFALSNSSLNAPFRKVTNGRNKFEEICKKFGEGTLKNKLVEELLSFLKWDKKHYPDELIDTLSHLPIELKPNYSAVYVNAPEYSYGTRTHTIILVDWKNQVEFHEWTLDEPINPFDKKWKETHQSFDISSPDVHQTSSSKPIPQKM